MTITTETVGRFIADLLNQHAIECDQSDNQVRIYNSAEPYESIETIEVEAGDPNNLIIEADGQRYTIRIIAGACR